MYSVVSQSRAAHLFVVPAFILSFSLSLNRFAKIPNGPIHFNAIFLTFIYSVHIEMCSSAISHNTPQYIPIACPRAFCPKGSWETDTPWGCCFHSLWEKHSRGRERTAAAAAAFLCLLDVTIMEICISEKRHSGPLGPKKYKYFNNKHFQCLPPVTTPGYYFTLDVVSQCRVLYA